MLNYNKEELLKVLESFNLLTGFRVGVFDDSAKEVASFPVDLARFCLVLRNNPEAELKCRQCDLKAFEVAARTKKLYVYQCAFGLYEAVMPILEKEELIGFMMIGQMLSTKPGTIQFISNLSRFYWKNEETQEQILNELPLLDYNKIQAAALIMSICASYLSVTRQVRKRIKPKSGVVKEYLDQHFKEPIEIKTLCNITGLGRTSMFSLMQNHFGMTLKQYCNGLRLEEAATLLASTDFSIKEIAFHSGFQDPNYFTRQFVKQYGQTPKMYRTIRQKTI